VPDFYVEQAFAAPLTTAAERSLFGRLISCGHEYGARLRDCLVDAEHHRILCRVEADDLQSARAALLCLGLESDATWLCAVPGLPAHVSDAPATTAGCPETTVALVDVIAECRQDAPIDAISVAREQRACDWCIDAFRVQPGALVVSSDRRRLLAFFRAPDAEAVRIAYRHASMPFDRVVALRRIDPSPAS
jgi:hypothetical protein